MDPKPARDLAATRLVSLDAYRGLIMISLAFGGFGLASTAQRHIQAGDDSTVWRTIYHQFEHVQWVGCGYWDLIQPSFMFMVGAAAAFSYGKRQQLGASWGGMFLHALVRSVVLIVLGIFLISNFAQSTVWSFMNVLTQIGLGYPFLFLLWGTPVVLQAIAALGILVGTFFLYTLYPAQGVSLETGDPKIGITAKWAKENLEGIAPAWQKNVNVGHEIDLWLLNQLPRRADASPFTFNGGGYQTINFVPSLATMLFGLLAGELLRGRAPPGIKFLILILAGLAGLASGWVLDYFGVCPLVKRIWTPSWALFSTGYCLLILAGFYLIVDVAGLKFWTFPLVVVGMNSIAIYVMDMLLKPWAGRTLQIHLGPEIFLAWGPLWEPLVRSISIGLMFWLMCWWMYRQRIFIRI